LNTKEGYVPTVTYRVLDSGLKLIKTWLLDPHFHDNSNLIETSYVIPPTRGRKDGVVFRIDFRIVTASAQREKEEPSLEEGSG
jgi:hypothetical protein